MVQWRVAGDDEKAVEEAGKKVVELKRRVKRRVLLRARLAGPAREEATFEQEFGSLAGDLLSQSLVGDSQSSSSFGAVLFRRRAQRRAAKSVKSEAPF